MKQSEATQILRHILWGVQKTRSNVMEAFGVEHESEVPDFIKAVDGKLVWDPQTLVKLTSLIDSGKVEVSGFWNWIYLFTYLEPSVGTVLILNDRPLPRWYSGAILSEWEPEIDLDSSNQLVIV